MLSNAEKVTVYGNEGPTDSTVGGWRLLLALVGWITLAVGTGVASRNALAPGWGGIDGRMLVILAEVGVPGSGDGAAACLRRTRRPA